MEDLRGLPDPFAALTSGPTVSQPLELPEGHPPASVEVDGSAAMCPFAAIQSALNQRAMERSTQNDLLSLNLGQIHEELETVPEATKPAQQSPRKSKGRQASSTKLEKMLSGSQLDNDAASIVRSQSKIASSSASKSRRTKKTRNSKASTKLQQGAVRRTRKAPTFSSWEAQTYIPPIKKSWQDILSTVSIEEVGVVFYDKLFEVGGHSIEHMFTTEKSIMAVKFAEMLASIVGSVDNPYSMYQKLQGLAPMHVEKGVGKQHLPIMGETLFGVLEMVLKDKFTVQVRTAWEWLWAWLGATFTQSIEEHGNEMTLISSSWNMAMDNCPDEALGELLYDTLFELAPNLKAVFSKPRQILSVKFVEMMSTLVSFHGKLDDNTYNEQLVWLGVRHVSYGAKFSHVDVLGQVLIATISTAVGEEWTEEMEEAWKELWVDTCQRLLKVTNEAERHGQRVQELWRTVQQRTTRAQFGSSLRKLLLSGTEWVQSLSSRPRASPDPKKEDKKAPLLATSRRRSEEDTKRANLPSSSDLSHYSLSGLTSPVSGAGAAGDVEPGGRGGGGGGSHDAEAIGHQFWEFTTVVLDLLWEPERQNEQLILMTTRFFKAGIRQEHLAGIGSAIETTCRRSLDLAWSEEYKEAWAWLWGLVMNSMKRTLQVLEQEHAATVRESWERCKAGVEVVDLGESIFKELASVAPYLVHLFKRPKRIQAAQFVAAVDILVSFLEDPDTFFVELKKLTIRHIKYGVKADYAKAFGTAILRGVRNAVGKDGWTAEVSAAWELLWDRVSNCLTRCLNAGTNLVIVSLVNGDLDKAREAMDCAPRGERFDTLTRVDVNGEVLSPLYWAIRDGMRDIALFLLEDLLSIRADRHKYYYGREKLFETHPDIVEVLCKDPGAEPLLDTLFNGLMWHASAVHQGRLRVNYYIKELYGDPEDEPNVWNSALATLALHAPPAIFDHPVCRKLLESKWDSFGKAMFFAIQGFYLLICVLYYVSFVVDADKCGPNGILRLVTGILAAISTCAQVLLAVHQRWNGLNGHMHISFPSWLHRLCGERLPAVVPLPRTLMNIFNVVRIPTYAAISLVAFNELCVGGMQAPPERDASTMVMSLVALVLGVLLLEVFMLQVQVASFMLVVQNLLPDVCRALLVCVVLIVSFAGALACAKAESFVTLGEGVRNLISMQLSMDTGLVAGGTGYTISLVSILVVAIQISVLNVLISQLVNKAAGINQWAHLMVSKKFAYTCVEMESLLPLGYRVTLFKNMGFDQPLDFENGDDGPSGGVQMLELASIRSDPKYVADRILRFTGEASEKDPWPSQTLEAEVEEEYDDRD